MCRSTCAAARSSAWPDLSAPAARRWRWACSAPRRPTAARSRSTASASQIDRPRSAMRHGIGLVPEDRKQQGLVLGLGVGTNLSLAAIKRMSRGGMIDFGAESSLVGRYIDRFRIKTPTAEQLVGLLSGGNQQKVVLAKWLATNPKVLIVDEPTRGVDVGTKAEIYALMRELAAEGWRSSSSRATCPRC